MLRSVKHKEQRGFEMPLTFPSEPCVKPTLRASIGCCRYLQRLCRSDNSLWSPSPWCRGGWKTVLWSSEPAGWGYGKAKRNPGEWSWLGLQRTFSLPVKKCSFLIATLLEKLWRSRVLFGATWMALLSIVTGKWQVLFNFFIHRYLHRL